MSRLRHQGPQELLGASPVTSMPRRTDESMNISCAYDQDFELTKYELEPLADDRITVAVECCGVCGSVRTFPSDRNFRWGTRC
jgi:hypothetical protein